MSATPLTDPTLGMLVEIAVSRSRSELDVLLLSSNLDQFSKGGYSKTALMVAAVREARAAAADGDQQAERALLSFAQRVATSVAPRALNDPAPRFDQLREALLADGYDLRCTWHDDPNTSGFLDEAPGKRLQGVQLMPTDPSPAPLAPEISALEMDLARLGLDTAANHYRQAVDNFVHHNFESANGQLRAMLESVVMHFAKHNGYTGQGKAGEGGAAINHLAPEKAGALPQQDGGTFVKGLWQMIHTNGPHPGRSSGDESRFRMQAVTAATRFLIAHFAPRS